MGAAIAEARPLPGESNQPTTKLQLLIGHDRLSPLGGTGLASYLASPALGDTKTIDQVIDRLSSPDRA